MIPRIDFRLNDVVGATYSPGDSVTLQSRADAELEIRGVIPMRGCSGAGVLREAAVLGWRAAGGRDTCGGGIMHREGRRQGIIESVVLASFRG